MTNLGLKTTIQPQTQNSPRSTGSGKRVSFAHDYSIQKDAPSSKSDNTKGLHPIGGTEGRQKQLNHDNNSGAT